MVTESYSGALRAGQVVEERGGGHHEPMEHSEEHLNWVDCSCGHRGSPSVTMADAYSSQFIHLKALALRYDGDAMKVIA